ncbi:MAG: T9SS type A sorting domain-containing protein [Bacteroidales bacterium]|nr:T9SS type A sorting domain-containing protein [Bacteroidales bacterium]
MITKLFIFLILFVACFSLQAQIVLTEVNTSFTPGTFNPIGANTTGYISPTIGANQQWNYSNLTQSNVYDLVYLTPSDVNFPSATYVDTGLSSVFIPGKYYYQDAYYQTDTNGANALGFVVNDQRYGSISANPTDSCIFPQQFCAYSNPNYTMPFPTTMSSSWSSNNRSHLNFELTVAAYSLNQTPCQKVTNTIRTDTVISWGKMRVPTVSGPSLAYDVLLVKRMAVQTDSFYMAGNPAPQPLLTAFGVSQGQATITNRYIFWRENARYPLLMINFGSNNFTTPTSIFYDGEALYDPNNSITDIIQNSDFDLYPNPCTGNFTIQLNNNEIQMPHQINIFNILGQEVYSQEISIISNGTCHLNVDNLKSGTYFVEVLSDFKSTTSKLIIQ